MAHAVCGLADYRLASETSAVYTGVAQNVTAIVTPITNLARYIISILHAKYMIAQADSNYGVYKQNIYS